MTEGATDMEVDGNFEGASVTQTADQQPSPSGLQPRPSEGTDTPATQGNGSGGSASDDPTPAIVGGPGDTTTNVNGEDSPVLKRGGRRGANVRSMGDDSPAASSPKAQSGHHTYELDQRLLTITYIHKDKTSKEVISKVVLILESNGSGFQDDEVVVGNIFVKEAKMPEKTLKRVNTGIVNMLRGVGPFIKGQHSNVFTIRIPASELSNELTQLVGRKFHPSLPNLVSFPPSSHRFPSPHNTTRATTQALLIIVQISKDSSNLRN